MDLRSMTLNEIKELQKQKLDELIQEAGTIKHLAWMLELPFSTVKGWSDRGRISKDGAKLVETHQTLGEKFKAQELRPDIQIN